jgi:hypothetical protein
LFDNGTNFLGNRLGDWLLFNDKLSWGNRFDAANNRLWCSIYSGLRRAIHGGLRRSGGYDRCAAQGTAIRFS